MGANWKKAKDVSINGGGAYLTPGHYLVKITKCKEKDADDGPGSWSIIEFEILESDNAAHKVGDTYSQVINMLWKGNMGYVAVKRFVAAGLGIDSDDHPTLASLNAEIERKAFEIFEQKMEVDEICEYVMNEDPFSAADLEIPLIVRKVETGGKEAKGRPEAEKKFFNRHEWQPSAI